MDERGERRVKCGHLDRWGVFVSINGHTLEESFSPFTDSKGQKLCL